MSLFLRLQQKGHMVRGVARCVVVCSGVNIQRSSLVISPSPPSREAASGNVCSFHQFLGLSVCPMGKTIMYTHGQLLLHFPAHQRTYTGRDRASNRHTQAASAAPKE